MKLSYIYENLVLKFKTLFEYKLSYYEKNNTPLGVRIEQNNENVFKCILKKMGLEVIKSNEDKDVIEKIDFQFSDKETNRNFKNKTVQFNRKIISTTRPDHFSIKLTLQEYDNQGNLGKNGIKQAINDNKIGFGMGNNRRRPKYVTKADFIMTINSDDDKLYIIETKELIKKIESVIDEIEKKEEEENKVYFSHSNTFESSDGSSTIEAIADNSGRRCLVAYIPVSLFKQTPSSFQEMEIENFIEECDPCFASYHTLRNERPKHLLQIISSFEKKFDDMMEEFDFNTVVDSAIEVLNNVRKNKILVNRDVNVVLNNLKLKMINSCKVGTNNLEKIKKMENIKQKCQNLSDLELINQIDTEIAKLRNIPTKKEERLEKLMSSIDEFLKDENSKNNKFEFEIQAGEHALNDYKVKISEKLNGTNVDLLEKTPNGKSFILKKRFDKGISIQGLNNKFGINNPSEIVYAKNAEEFFKALKTNLKNDDQTIGEIIDMIQDEKNKNELLEIYIR